MSNAVGKDELGMRKKRKRDQDDQGEGGDSTLSSED